MSEYFRDNVHFLRINSRWITSGFLLMLFSSFGQTFFIGLSGNEIQRIFHLSSGGFGGLYMLATLASALTLPWLGRTLDFMSGWKVVAFSMPCLAIACILIAIAPNITLLTISIYLLRLFGQGMMTEIAFTETGRWFVANRGRAMAFITTGQQVGTAVLPAIIVAIAQWHGDWRSGWFASAVVLALIGWPLVTFLMRKERVPQSREIAAARERTARDWTRGEVLRDPVFYLLLIGTLAPAFIGTVIFFHQGYLITIRNYDPLAFAAAYVVMSVTTVIFGFVCGYLIDRFGALKLLPYFLLPLAVASIGVAIITPIWGVYVFMLLLGISNGFTSTLSGALWPEVYGLANLGGIRAVVVAAMVFGTAAGPGITGILMDFDISLPTQMFFMGGWCVIASFLLKICAQKIAWRECH